mgnify:CR=1 FL=1
MIYPNFFEEKKLWRKGFKIVIGLDEAGRGPLAGPVVAGAICFPQNFEFKILHGIKDSKKLNEKQRDYFYKILTTNSNIRWGVGIVSEKIIDRINILQATKLAMKKAIEQIGVEPDFILLDGNFNVEFYCATKQKCIVNGDAKVISCCAAGIIAKVTRDRIMKKYHEKYPEYGFDKNKGYPTSAHFTCLKSFGPCKIHRKSFYPINNFIK